MFLFLLSSGAELHYLKNVNLEDKSANNSAEIMKTFVEDSKRGASNLIVVIGIMDKTFNVRSKFRAKCSHPFYHRLVLLTH